MRRAPRSKLKFNSDVPYKTRDELVDAIDKLCKKLSGVLSPDEQAEGWTEMRRIHFLEFFKELEADLRAGIDIPYIPIGKNLDHFGISNGQLFEDACLTDVALNERKW